MPAVTVSMGLARITKGALRYEGAGQEAPDSDGRLMGTLYLRKEAVRRLTNSDEWPQRITVTVGTEE